MATELETMVVRLQAEAAQYTKTIREAGQLATKTEREIGGVSKSIRKMGRSLNKFGVGAVKTMGKFAAKAGVLLGAGGGAAALGFGVKLAAEAEQAEIAFTTLLGSADDAKRMLADLERFAADTPFQLPGIRDAAKQLTAFGIEQNNILPTLQSLGDVSAGIGQPLGEIAEIFGKAKVQGRLFMEDINQLTGRGIPIIGELASQFGVAESEVRELVSSGSVSFNNLQTAFQSLTSEGGKFAGLMEAQSQSVAGKFSTMKDNVSRTLKEFGMATIEAFNIKGGLDRAIGFLQKFANNAQANIGALVSWTRRQWEGLQGFFREHFGWLSGASSGTWSKMVGYVQDFAGKAIGFFRNWSDNVGRLTTWFLDNWQNVLSDAMNAAVTYAKNLPHNIGVGLNLVGTYFRNLFTKDFIDFAMTGLEAVGKSFANFADYAWDTLKAVFKGEELPSFDDFVGSLGQNFSEVDTDFLGNLKRDIEKESSNFKNPLDGFVAKTEALPEMNLEVGGIDLPDFVWEEANKAGEDASKGFAEGVKGLADPAVAEAKKASRALGSVGIEALESGSLAAKIRIDQEQLNRPEVALKQRMVAEMKPTPKGESDSRKQTDILTEIRDAIVERNERTVEGLAPADLS